MDTQDVSKELSAMQSISEVFTPLSDEARQRIISWTISFFGINFLGEKMGRGISDETIMGASLEEEPKSMPQDFQYFAELFNRADPKTQEEKVLCAAYWVQEIEGKEQWKSSDLQKLLKDQGEVIEEISRVLNRAIKKRPSPILQLRKNGNSKQARKDYKMTQHGIDNVVQMLE